MTNLGLSFENSFFQDANGVPSAVVNPFALPNTASASGSDALRDDLSNLVLMGGLGVQLARQNRFTMPEMAEPSIAYSKSRNQLFVQGVTLDADDAQGILEAQSLLDGPPTGLPKDGDWTPLSRRSFFQLVEGINNPSLGTLAARNFGRGVDELQLLAGRGLQLFGAEKLGQSIVDQQLEDLRKTAPYDRRFTDIESGRDAVEWLVANFAQQGPNLIESIVTAGLGFLAGSAASGTPIGGAAAALGSLLGKAAWKESVKSALAKKASGQALNAAEQKLLREAAAIAGAVASAVGQNALTGAADIYGELRDQGATADDITARLTALAGSIPYAALESLPEFLLAGRILRNVGAPTRLSAGTKPLARAGELLKRGAIGFGVGGTAEGATELGQEALVLKLSGQDLDSPQAVDRLINAFAAGFGVGGPIGAVANLRGREPTNLLNPAQNPTPTPNTGSEPLALPAPPAPSEFSGPPSLPAPPASPTPPALTASSVTSTGGLQVMTTPQGVPYTDVLQHPRWGNPRVLVTPEGVAYPDADFSTPPIMVTPEGVAYPDVVLRQNGNIQPGAVPGSQGVLDVFGGQIPAQELVSRMQPPAQQVVEQPAPTPTPTPTPTPNPAQGALQFSTPLPNDGITNTQLADKLKVIRDRLQRQREFEAAQAAREAVIQQQLDELARQSQNARDLYTLQQQLQQEKAAATQQTAIPMRQAGPRQPVQLPLFTRRQAPVPSRAEGLRRGVGTRLPTTPDTPVELPQAGRRKTTQLTLLDEAGQPTLAALRSAGEKTESPKPTTTTTQQVPKPALRSRGGLKTQAGVAEVNVLPTETANAAQKGDVQQNRVGKHPQDNARVRSGRDTGQQSATQVTEGRTQTSDSRKSGDSGTSKAETLRRGKSAKVEKTTAAKLRVVVEPLSPEEAWEDMKPKGASKFNKLPRDVRIKWAEAVNEGKASMLLAEQLLGRDEQTPLEEVKSAFDAAVAAKTINEFKFYISSVVDYALVQNEDNENRAAVKHARELLRNTEFTDAQKAAIDSVLIRLVNDHDKIEAVYTRGLVKGNSKPWFDYVVQRGLLPKINTVITGLSAEKAAKFVKDGQLRLSNLPQDTAKKIRVDTGATNTASKKTTEESKKSVTEVVDEFEFGEDANESSSLLDDWNTNVSDDGNYFRNDGTPITNPIPIGRVQILTKAFLSKLSVKPKVYIYRNQADLKAKNPQLYKQATAARPKGDFDTANAVGYTFGDGNVIIFADRVVTEDQLRFVLAHEALGHFGFRGLLSERELNAAFDKVYSSSAKVRAAVDTAVQTRGMSRREAIEEYLADFAGFLDTNIIARFWNAIKNALNRLGVRFDDDMARYLVSQARRYVRNGITGGRFVDFKEIASRMGAIERMDDPDGSGRFALAGEFYDEVNRIAATEAFGRRSFKLSDVTNILQRLKDRAVNIGDFTNRLLGELKTMNYLARENQGYRRLYEIFRDTSKTAAQLRAGYNKMMSTVLSPAVELFGGKFTKGATKEQIARVSEMLIVTSRVKMSELTETELRKMGSLITIVDGEAQLNQQVFEALAARGKFTVDDFRNGITYKVRVPRPMTEERRAALRAERDEAMAMAEDDAERKAIARAYQKLIDAPSYMVEVEQKFPPMPDLTEDSIEWVMYNEVRDTMNKSAIDLLLANFAAAKGERANVERTLQNFLGRLLTENDKEFIKKITDKYLELRAEGSEIDENGVLITNRESVAKANDFIAKFNAALLGLDSDRNDAVRKFFDEDEADDVIRGIEELKKGSSIPRSGANRFVVQHAIQNMALFELSKIDAELFAKRSIAGGYVPFGREGAWQVRIQAVDPVTGRIYKVSELYRQQLLFVQVDDRAEAEAIAARVQALLDEVEGGFEMEVLDGADYVIKRVRLVAQPETARETVTTTVQANLNEVIAAITRFSINITPEERERLIVGLTKQNSQARNRLQRAGTPGEDPNVIKYVSQHLEATASTVARKQHRHRLDRLFDDNDPDSLRLWYGDKVEYERRKAAWEAAKNDPNMSEAAKLAAKREFDDYHYTFVTKESPVMGNRFKDRGRRLVAFMESQSNVDYTDFGSGELVSSIRTATTFTFMGASLATAILNYLSLATNVLPALSGYNSKNAFGGGFGWGMSAVELSRAINATKNAKQSDVAFWDDLLENPDKLKASGFTEAEARFMQKEVGGGTMQAALTNSLLGSARGKFRSGAAKAAAEAWMSLFNFTEQHSRRATGLAAFRMAYARALAEGKDADTAFEVADRFAVEMIDNTLGEYAMYNRPAMFRGDVRQFLFMFKMFPVNTIQMLAALPRKEQLLALGILALFSGLKGLPFAEDLMDILDTIAQALGLGPSKLWRGSAERTLAEALDAIAPGMTPVLMRGLLNTITPANIADRVSLSNIIPGTGIALAGTNVGRELVEIAGPVVSFLQGAVAMSADVARYGLEALGVLDDRTSFVSILRESPVVMLRALGDVVAYSSAGAIVNQKGYVVSYDLHLGTILARALGFYPAAATAENDVVRLSKRISDYQKDVAATYRGLYVAAMLSGDTKRAAEVKQMVADWNAAAKGTGLEIRNFNESAYRALREAQRTTTERYLKAAPRAMRPETQKIIRLLGVPEDDATEDSVTED